MYSFSLCAQGRIDGVLKVNLSPKLALNVRGSSVLCSEKDTGRLCRETPRARRPCNVGANGTAAQWG